MTLMEVVVYCALLSLFSIMMFLTLPTRSSQATLALQEAAQEAAVALRKISQELANSSRSHVSSSKEPPWLTFPSAVPKDDREFAYFSDGGIAWTGWVAYLAQDGKLMRHWSPYSAPTASSKLGLPPSFGNTKGGQPIVKALSSISAHESAPKVWTIALTVAADGSEIEMRTAVEVRNP